MVAGGCPATTGRTGNRALIWLSTQATSPLPSSFDSDQLIMRANIDVAGIGPAHREPKPPLG
jgi:hypothetical protein